MHTSLSPFQLVVFGAFGHLAAKSIYPSLYELALQRRLPDAFHVIGCGRSAKDAAQLRAYVESAIRTHVQNINEHILTQLLEHISYLQGDYASEATYRQIEQQLIHNDANLETMWLTYLAVPPTVYEDIIGHIGTLSQHRDKYTLLFEKPFGTDTMAAERLFEFVHQYFDEKHILIIDHYLAKNAVQNILSLRELNPLLHLALKGENIAHIEITAHESEGIGDRHGYFDTMGTLKDMVQSHLFQLLALLTMDIPQEMSARSIHREKIAMLEAMRIHNPAEIIYGQYEGYTPQGSPTTETFVALTITFDKAEWNGVHVYIRTGKKLAAKQTYITVTLRDLPGGQPSMSPNRIVFELQPQAKLHLLLTNKATEIAAHTLTEVMSESKLLCVGDDCLPDHAKLLIYALEGKHEYFADIDEVLAGWRILDIAESVKCTTCPIHIYPKGSTGPASADHMAAHHTWFNLPS